MALFNIPNRNIGRNTDKSIARKTRNKKKSTTTIKSGGLLQQISNIKAMVEKNLGKYKKDYIIISDIDSLTRYIDKCIENNVISIDTETTGLDPIQDKIVGICIYTPDLKPAYIPINHISYVTGVKAEGQLDVKDCKQEFDRIAEHNIDVIMFNAKFDIRVLRNQIGSYLTCTWDCYLCAKLLNENEPTHGLKALHKKYVLNGEGDAFSFDALFKGVTFDKIPINVGYLYAAHDAIITYELYKFQKPCLDKLPGVSNVFYNIEMPVVNVVCDMEDNGILLDLEYADKLSKEYHEKLQKCENNFFSICNSYNEEIESYKVSHPNNKLSDPINISSPTQIAILLYDILKVKPVDKKSPRGTGEEILRKINNSLCEAILEYRTVTKLLGTYIDKLPECVNPKDGRIHCSFNQYGAKTGRFSSSDPNLQNIPSHNKDIRKMFTASEGYLLMSSDFSQQEPKCLAALCKLDGDSQMYDTFMEGKDLYSAIASKAFNVAYEDCLEFRPDGTTNKEGKERRTRAKSILLGVLYGRGVNSIAEQLKTSSKKAQEIKDSVFRGFPAISKFEKDSKQMAYDLGYVTTVCGRKRRLPEYCLPEFEFSYKDGVAPDDDPLDFDDVELVTEVPDNIRKRYTSKLHNAYYAQKTNIIREAKEQGIIIKDNGGKIADAERQVVNARIQGSAADLTKLAMIELGKNRELKNLGFRLLIPVHDEIIAECPQENIKQCSALLAETMSKAAENILKMPIKCDVAVTKQWYGEEMNILD